MTIETLQPKPSEHTLDTTAWHNGIPLPPTNLPDTDEEKMESPWHVNNIASESV
jgi:hypothetical protein